MRIVANMSMAQCPMALCTCSTYCYEKIDTKTFTAIGTTL
jgi:hypothetical protein